MCRGGTDPKTVKYMDLIYKFKVKSFKIVTIYKLKKPSYRKPHVFLVLTMFLLSSSSSQ